MAKSKTKSLPPRSKIKTDDTWDLSSLFASDKDWEKAFDKWRKQINKYEQFRGTLAQGPEELAACLKFDLACDRQAERLGYYAHLKTTEDQANSTYQGMSDRLLNVATRASEAASFIQPEILAIPSAKMEKMLASPKLRPYKLMLERMLRFKKHTLGKKEEALLAMQGEMAQTASKAFRQLTDADLRFGFVQDEEGREIELSQATLSQFLHSPQRSVRKQAFHQFYEQFAGHENTTAATLSGSVLSDLYYARVRNYDSALSAALFQDNVPAAVYENLISAVHQKLPAVHHYYDVRRRKMKLRDIHMYDTYVPIVHDMEVRRTWNRGVKVVIESLAPLGSQYTDVLEAGLTTDRWCDRYPNRGKQSGAFSAGSFDGNPYILMNYKPEVLDDVFTLAHEAGHSMHSYYSSKHQPYQYYDYSIFVAEVASTFNEQLLSRYLTQRAKTDEERAYLINRDIDAMRGTIVRQTMFAEFEKITHEMAEAGEPLTVEAFKSVYGDLLKKYFGPDFVIDEQLKLDFGLERSHQ